MDLLKSVNLWSGLQRAFVTLVQNIGRHKEWSKALYVYKIHYRNLLTVSRFKDILCSVEIENITF